MSYYRLLVLPYIHQIRVPFVFEESNLRCLDFDQTLAAQFHVVDLVGELISLPGQFLSLLSFKLAYYTLLLDSILPEDVVPSLIEDLQLLFVSLHDFSSLIYLPCR